MQKGKREIGTVGWVIIVVGLVFIFMTGVWTIDVSAPWINQNAVATSGWWDRIPVQSYHAGLYITIVSFVLLTLVAVYHICKRGGEKRG